MPEGRRYNFPYKTIVVFVNKETIMKHKKILAGMLTMGFLLSSHLFTAEAADMDNNEQSSRTAVKIVQTAGRTQLGEFAPDFARYNDDILFGEVWSRNDKLSLHDRSIVTVSTLVASGVSGETLRYHIETAKKNGVTKDEMVEILTQLAFYAGWPKAWGAFPIAKDVYSK